MSVKKDMGWVKVHRRLLESPTWEALNNNRRVLMITILLLANHKDKDIYLKDGTKFTVKKGQLLTSLDSLSKKCGVSKEVVRKALSFFKMVEFSTQESPQGRHQNGTLITVANWELYQSNEKIDTKEEHKREHIENTSRTLNKNVKNEKKNNLFVETAIEFQLSKYLFELIRKNNPKAKEPNFQTWSKQFDLMIRIDKREVQEIKDVINWCQNDSFWYKNIISPKKLREKYDQLIVKMFDVKPIGKYKPDTTQVQSTDIYNLDENGDISF